MLLSLSELSMLQSHREVYICRGRDNVEKIILCWFGIYVILLPIFMDLESERQQVEILEGMYW